VRFAPWAWGSRTGYEGGDHATLEKAKKHENSLYRTYWYAYRRTAAPSSMGIALLAPVSVSPGRQAVEQVQKNTERSRKSPWVDRKRCIRSRSRSSNPRRRRWSSTLRRRCSIPGTASPRPCAGAGSSVPHGTRWARYCRLDYKTAPAGCKADALGWLFCRYPPLRQRPGCGPPPGLLFQRR
jgi:hypothetical protein